MVGKHVVQVAQSLEPLAGGDTRSANDQRDAHAVVVHVLLAQQTVLPDGQPVVGGVDHDGVIGVAGVGERVK